MMIKSESYFTVGMILSVLTLYGLSVYSHFSSEDLDQRAYAYPAGSEEAQREAGKILDAINTGNNNLFKPIGESTLYVPGTNCQVTNGNLLPSGRLYQIPENCFLVESSLAAAREK